MNKTFLLLLLSISIGVHAQTNKNFNHLFDKWNDDDLKPGVAIAIIHEGEIILQKEVGYGNLEYRVLLDKKSVFDIASLAKQFTGFAVAKLLLEGKLHFNDSVSQYLPELEILENGITIRHLVYHTSGLRDVAELFELSNLGENLTSKEALILLKNQKGLNFTPGTEYDYSNTNYVLLALIVEQVTGLSFREWCTLNIFQPLKMENTFVNDNPYQIIENRVVAYYSGDDNFSYQQNNGMALIGSSAVYSNMNDMILWIKALQFETAFSKEFRLMKKGGSLDNGEEIGYGFGLGIGKYNNELMIEHSGATPSGFRTQMAIFPNQSLAFVILSNWGDISPIDDFGREIINTFVPYSEQENEQPEELQNASILLTKEVIHRYVGDYLFNEELNVKIRHNKGNELTVQLEDQPEVPLLPITETEFDLPALQSKLHFVVNPSELLSQRAEIYMGDRKEGELRRINLGEKTLIDYSKYTGIYYCRELGIVFEVGLINNQLTIKNTKLGDVILKDKTEVLFIPEEGIASSLVFTINDSNKISAFLLNRGSRVRNLEFTKIDIND